MGHRRRPEAAARRAACDVRRAVARCARASAKRHHTRPGGVAPAAFAPPAHRKKVLATGATGLCTPSQKKEKHRRSPCKAVALVAGCFDRSSVPSSVNWWPPTPRPGPPQVADLTTRRCPRQPKAATTRHCLVPVLCRSAKTSFPGRGPLRCAPWSFSRLKQKEPNPCRVHQETPCLVLVPGLPGLRKSSQSGVRPVVAESPLPDQLRQHTREGPRPGNRSNGSPLPFPKKGRTQKESVQTRCRRCRVLCPRFRVLLPSKLHARVAAGSGPGAAPVSTSLPPMHPPGCYSGKQKRTGSRPRPNLARGDSLQFAGESSLFESVSSQKSQRVGFRDVRDQ